MSYIIVKDEDKKVVLDNAQELPKTFYDTAGADITAADVLKDKIAYGADGKVIGTLERLDPEMPEPLCFENIGENAGGIFVYLLNTQYQRPDLKFMYSYDKETWTDFVVPTTNTPFLIEVDSGEKVYVKGPENMFLNSVFPGSIKTSGGFNLDSPLRNMFSGVRFSINGTIKVSGNIASLVSNECKNPNFAFLFSNILSNNSLYADELILPYDYASGTMYYGMFYNSSGLRTAPNLPARYVNDIAYSAMFSSCSNLTQAPTINSIRTNGTCFYRMFDGCQKLEGKISFGLTTLGYGYSECWYMFNNVRKITEVNISVNDIAADQLIQNNSYPFVQLFGMDGADLEKIVFNLSLKTENAYNVANGIVTFFTNMFPAWGNAGLDYYSRTGENSVFKVHITGLPDEMPEEALEDTRTRIFNNLNNAHTGGSFLPPDNWSIIVDY